MDPYIVSLLETLVELDEGGYGHVFSVNTISEQSDTSLWHCHLCDVKGADEMSLTLHIESKEHVDLMALPSHPRKKFTNIEKMAEPKDIELGQPAPPGTEEIDIKPSETLLQSKLDSYKESPLIGAEYVVEILRPGFGQEPYCCCMLCDKKCDPRTVLGHLTGYIHRLKYTDMHFPTFLKTMQERIPRNKTGKKQMADLITRVVTRIEEKFGRLCPLYVEKEENFEDRKELILKKISEDNHFKETPSETFVEVLDESDENDVKPVSAGLPKFVDSNAYVQPTAVEQEPEPLGRLLSQLETLLESHKNNPIVGLDYLVELRDPSEEEHMYFCTLCEKIGDPRVTIVHLTSLKHRLKFIGQHFPKTKEALNNKFKDEKQILTKALKFICGKIEGKHGRQSPVVANRMVFECNKDIMIKKILDSKYFREPLDDTFVDIIENKKKFLKSIKLEDSEDLDITEINRDVDDLDDGKVNIKEKTKKVRRKTESNIEATLKSIGRPVIGVEYLIELTSSKLDKEPVFMCAYCDKKGDPRVAMNHFTSYKHCAKYINVFFPTAKKSILYLLGTMKECKKGIGEMIMTLCAQIQEKYGWLRPRSYDEDYFERNRKTIIDEITDGEHLRETPEENFVEFVEETLKGVTSYKDYDAPTLDIPPVLLPPPPKVIERGPQLYDNPFCSIVRQMPAPPLSAVSPLPVITPRHLPPPTKYMPPLPKDSPVYTQKILRSGRSSTILQVPLQKPEQTRNEQQSKRTSGLSSIIFQVPRQEPVQTRNEQQSKRKKSNTSKEEEESLSLAEKKSIKFQIKSPLAKNVDKRSGTQGPMDWKSLKAKLPEKSRSRSRSRSPLDFDFGRMSPVDEGLKNTLKWEIYMSKLKELQEELVRDRDYYRMNPESHPSYGEEWKNFWNDWYDRMEGQGKDPIKQNIMPEWISFWNKRVQELFRKKFENKKQDLKRTHGLNVLQKPETKKYHEKMETHEDIYNKRKGERSKSGSPPLKQSRDTNQDKKSRERSQEREILIERSRKRFEDKTQERTQDGKSRENELSRDKSREKRIQEETKERRSRGENREERHERERKFRGGPRERARRAKEEAQERGRKSREETYKRDRKSRDESPSSRSAKSYLEKSRQKYKNKEPNEENQSIKSNIINTGLVSALRIAAALEDQLGSLGPKVNALLGTALALEKMAMHASDALLANSEHFSLLETVKEKLRGQLMARIVDRNMVLATTKCVDSLERVLTKAEKDNALGTMDIDISPVSTRTENSRSLIGEIATVPVSATIDKVAIAQKIASFLIKEGKFDVSQEELEQLINYVAVKQSSPVSLAASLAGFPSQMQQQQQKNLPGNSVSVVQLQQQQWQQQQNQILSGNSLLMSNPVLNMQQQQQQQHQNQIQPGTSSTSLMNTIERLSDNDLHNLLKYFNVLRAEEQQALIKYLKMLELTHPEKVNELQESLNIRSAISALNKAENLERSSSLLEQRKQVETSNVFSQFGNRDNSSHVEYSFVKQFRDREKPSAELEKMKGLAEDLRERKNDILRQITSGLTDTTSKPENRERATSSRTEYQNPISHATGSSYGSQLQ